MSKSNIIGIFVAATYILMLLLISFLIDGWWALVFGIIFALPFSMFSFVLFLNMANPEVGLIIFLITNTIWLYFFTKLIYSVIKDWTKFGINEGEQRIKR